jgi:UDP-GlcNAc3NAcA epimerase
VKVLSIVGNRPQFVKAAPLAAALGERGIQEVVLHTGQHYDRELSQVFFEEFGLPEPQYRLGIGAAEREEMVTRMRPGIRAAISAERPSWVIVYGDTNSTLAGARAAADENAPLAHVEAGLRSGDWSMPEERNRVEVDRLAELLLGPDERSRATLAAEGVEGHAEVVGDVMADTCLRLAPVARSRSSALARFGVEPGRYLVATIHREANVAPARLRRIVEGLNRLPLPLVFPAHPRTRRALGESGLSLGSHVAVSEPLGYLDFAALVSQGRVLLTDSGGLQKEAYWYGVPCVTLRPSTEWTATVEVGANELVDDDPDRILAAVDRARMPERPPQLYGDGAAAGRIAEALCTLSAA